MTKSHYAVFAAFALCPIAAASAQVEIVSGFGNLPPDQPTAAVVGDGEESWPELQDMDIDDSETEESDDEPDLREPPGLLIVRDLRPPGGGLGGGVVRPAEAPWQVQIFYPKVAQQWNAQIKAGVPIWSLQHFCGGGLIAPNWVITAAHCIDDKMRTTGYRVRLGATSIEPGAGWDYKIERVVVHPRYFVRTGGDYNDIALIKIANDKGHELDTRLASKVSLFKGGDLPPNRRLTVYGWGRTSDRGNGSWPVLLKFGLAVMARPECRNYSKLLNWIIDPTVICATSPPGTIDKTCRGDSGGAVVDNATRQLVGVVSGGGARCISDGIPSIYTRIGPYLPWIRQATGGVVQ